MNRCRIDSFVVRRLNLFSSSLDRWSSTDIGINMYSSSSHSVLNGFTVFCKQVVVSTTLFTGIPKCRAFQNVILCCLTLFSGLYCNVNGHLSYFVLWLPSMSSCRGCERGEASEGRGIREASVLWMWSCSCRGCQSRATSARTVELKRTKNVCSQYALKWWLYFRSIFSIILLRCSPFVCSLSTRCFA